MFKGSRHFYKEYLQVSRPLSLSKPTYIQNAVFSSYF